jgi:hypothetical protein
MKTNLYLELRDKHAEMKDCFFAFSDDQLDKGIEEYHLEGKQICRAGNGLYGTKEGIEDFCNFYANNRKEIAEKCNPQEVYNEEFVNHECSYVGNDKEAFDIVTDYFGDERALELKRAFAIAN